MIKLGKSLALLALLLALPPAYAATPVACPDLSRAVQVGQCPTEDELRYAFASYCSEDARMYDKGDQLCTDFAKFRAAKNIVLWESADGSFHNYLSCKVSTDQIRKAKPAGIAVARQNGMTRLVCSYQDGISFTHRTKAVCKTEGDGQCSGGDCKASCE